MTTPRASLLTRILAIASLMNLLVACDFVAGTRTSVGTSAPPPIPPSVPAAHTPPATGPAPVAVYTGELALTIFAPPPSALTPPSTMFNVTVRAGGAYGPIVLSGAQYHFDAYGTGVVDLFDLEYGLYDVEIVGFDAYGDSVSYAAASVALESPFVALELDLEAVMLTGDVILDLYAPDGGTFSGPIDSIDYFLWEIDPATGQATIVEQIFEVPAGPYDSPLIAGLQLGTYYLEVDAYDVFGYRTYSWAGEFAHDSPSTFLTLPMWYAQ